jgi:hypothetical protein
MLSYASSRMRPPTSPPPSRLLPQALLAAGAYAAATLYYLRPIWEVFCNSLAPNAADPLFSVYILKWVVRQIHLGFPNLWDANFFYPARGTLAMSDHMLGPALQVALVGNPIAGYNLLVFSSFVLCGAGTFWVLRRSGIGGPAALLGGAAFAFSPFRMSHLNHLLMLIMQWIPLTLWSFDRLLAERTARRGAQFLLFYGLHLTSGCYFAYMIHLPMAAIFASRWAAAGRRRLFGAQSLRVLAPVAALAVAAAVAIFLPYLRLARRLDMTHDDHQIGRRGGAALASWVSPAPESLYSLHSPGALWDRAGLVRWQQPFTRSENSLFPGFLPALAAGWGLWEIWRRYRVGPATAAAAEAVAVADGNLGVTGTHGAGAGAPGPGAETHGAGAGAPGPGAEAGLRPAGRRPAGRRPRLLRRGLAAVALAAFALGDVYTLGFARDLPPLDRWSESAAWNVLGVVLLACLGLLVWLRRRDAGSLWLRWGEVDPWHRGLLLGGLLSFALSFPVIYFPLMHVVPGLHSMRAPARFAAFVSLAVAFLMAWGLDRLAERAGLAGQARPAGQARHTGRAGQGRHRFAAAAAAVGAVGAWSLAGAVLAVELAPRPVRWVRVLQESEFPEVYSWISGRPEIHALVEVPLRPNWTEAAYMYYSTRHWKPIANGYSSFVPASYDELAPKVRLLPEADGFELLERMGISHLVVHTDLLVKRLEGESEEEAEARGAAMVRDWERRFLARRIELVYGGDLPGAPRPAAAAADPDRVYRLIPLSTGVSPAGVSRRTGG